MNLFDLSGQSLYKELRKEFYPDTQGILLVFDVAAADTFVGLDAWLREIESEVWSPALPFVSHCHRKGTPKFCMSHQLLYLVESCRAEFRDCVYRGMRKQGSDYESAIVSPNSTLRAIGDVLNTSVSHWPVG